MIPTTRTLVPALTPCDPEVLAQAASVASTLDEHARLAARLPCLDEIAVRPPADVSPAPGARLRVAAWNAERCKYGPASAALLGGLAPDVLLLTEMDVGMARSGNRDTVADLAGALGLGFAFGVEFVELGIGDDRERVWHRGESNAAGFHGNAILSRWPLSDITLVRLADGGSWFEGPMGQRRLGERMAVSARLETGSGPLRLVAIHLENRSTPDERAAQVARLLAALPKGEERVVFAGDLNTGAVPVGPLAPDGLAELATREPLFAHLAAAGFDWRSANTSDVTQRRRPDGTPVPPFRRIDWMAVRGVGAIAPATVPATDAEGAAISDHEVIAATIVLS